MRPTLTYIYMTLTNSKAHWLLWSLHTTKNCFFQSISICIFVLVHCIQSYDILFSVKSVQ